MDICSIRTGHVIAGIAKRRLSGLPCCHDQSMSGVEGGVRKFEIYDLKFKIEDWDSQVSSPEGDDTFRSRILDPDCGAGLRIVLFERRCETGKSISGVEGGIV